MNAKIVIICGPTSSGKTALALRLGKGQPTSIISADSRQVFTGLDTLTGKDIPLGFSKKFSSLVFKNRPVIFYEKDNLRLWGFGLLQPDEVFNAADFSNLTLEIINTENQAGRAIMIVGGTGFYLKSLTQPNLLAPTGPDAVLRDQLAQLSAPELAQKLWEIDPQKFVSLNQSDASNPRRLIRAIELSLASTGSVLVGKPRSYQDGPCSFVWLGISVSLDVLRTKIVLRVASRLDSAIAEVRKLKDNFPDQSLPIYTTLGVKPILRYLAGEISKDRLKEIWITDEVNYVKRQLTWFKKQKQIIWYDQNSLTKLALDQIL